jgi:hypothetical protein
LNLTVGDARWSLASSEVRRAPYLLLRTTDQPKSTSTTTNQTDPITARYGMLTASSASQGKQRDNLPPVVPGEKYMRTPLLVFGSHVVQNGPRVPCLHMPKKSRPPMQLECTFDEPGTWSGHGRTSTERLEGRQLPTSSGSVSTCAELLVSDTVPAGRRRQSRVGPRGSYDAS